LLFVLAAAIARPVSIAVVSAAAAVR